MAEYNLTREQHEAEVKAGSRNFLKVQPVVEGRDPIISAIRDFVHEERQKSFAFLGQYSHAYSDEQVFGIELDNIATIKGVCRRRRYDLSKYLGDPIPNDVRCYTFRAKIFDIAKTMPVRLLEASTAASLTVPITVVLSDVVLTQLDGTEDYEMLDVLTGNVESDGNTLAPGYAQPTVPIGTVPSILEPGSFECSSNSVYGQEDDEMVNGEADIYGGDEGSDSQVPIESIEVLDWINDGAWVGVREWIRKEFNYESDAFDWRVPQDQLEEQILWWKNNGLSFRLLDLPAELHNLVYEEARIL